jgi:hypothetical protein
MSGFGINFTFEDEDERIEYDVQPSDVGRPFLQQDTGETWYATRQGPGAVNWEKSFAVAMNEDAANVAFEPTGSLTDTNVQDVIVQLNTQTQDALAEKMGAPVPVMRGKRVDRFTVRDARDAVFFDRDLRAKERSEISTTLRARER